MLYAVISDVHSNHEGLTAVLEVIEDLEVDRTVCLGDVVGYNASPNECIEIIREREIPTICGNHDAVACCLDEPWGFNPIALAAALWTREALTEDNAQWLRELPDMRQFEFFLMVHGAPGDKTKYLFEWEDIVPYMGVLNENECSVCFFGHTHSPGIFSKDGVYSVDDDSRFAIGEDKDFFINPGSVGQPRDGDSRASFGLLDTEKKEFELIRVPYAVGEAADKVIEAGLPQFLAERLHLGR